MKSEITAIILIATTCGCATAPPRESRFEVNTAKGRAVLFTNAYAHINVSDGIDSKEAEWLGQAYFLSYISGCGMTTDPIDRGDYWEVPVLFGYAGNPIEPISIVKSDGRMSHRHGPTFAPPDIIFEINDDPTKESSLQVSRDGPPEAHP